MIRRSSRDLSALLLIVYLCIVLPLYHSPMFVRVIVSALMLCGLFAAAFPQPKSSTSLRQGSIQQSAMSPLHLFREMVCVPPLHRSCFLCVQYKHLYPRNVPSPSCSTIFIEIALTSPTTVLGTLTYGYSLTQCSLSCLELHYFIVFLGCICG